MAIDRFSRKDLMNLSTEKRESGRGRENEEMAVDYFIHKDLRNLIEKGGDEVKPLMVSTPRAHEHNLVFLEKNSYKCMCDCCQDCSYGLFFSCVQCPFILGADCFPYPRVVKTKHHLHPLTLSDPPSIEEDDDDDDNDNDYEQEYLCDACEKGRDPKHQVYFCAECQFVSHRQCSLTKGEYIVEENISLAQKLKELKLDIDKSEAYKLDGKQEDEEIKPALTMVVFSDSMLEVDHIHKQLNSVLEAIVSENVGFKDIFLSDQQEDLDNKFEASLRKMVPFTKFMEIFDNHTRNVTLNLKNVKIIGSEIVEVGGYMIPKTLAPILESLFVKYGDIGAGSIFSLDAKTCVVNNFCDAIYSMQNTKFEQLSESVLFSWWLSFKYARHAGFKVQFIGGQLKRIVRAQMIVRIKAFTDLVVEETDKKIAELQLKGNKLWQEREKHEAAKSGSKFRELCFCELSALKMVCKGVNVGLLL